MKRFKQYISFLSLFCILCSCHVATPEENGKALAEEFIKKQLYYPDSYEALECVVDTAYSPIETPETIDMLSRFADLYQSIQLQESTVKSKESSYELYKSHYNNLRKLGLSDTYTEYQYKTAKEELAKEQEKYDKIFRKLQELASNMQTLNDQPRTPCGWKIVQTYKAKTQGGMIATGGIYLLSDNDFQKVLVSVDEKQLNTIMSLSKEFNAQ